MLPRGAVTTLDRAQHMIAAQLEADFCLQSGSIALARTDNTPALLSGLVPEGKGAARKCHNFPTLRVGNYEGLGLVNTPNEAIRQELAKRPLTGYVEGFEYRWLGWLNELLEPSSQRVNGGGIYYTPSRMLLESVVPERVTAQEVKCAVPGVGMMRRVDSRKLRRALVDEITGERIITTAPRASAGAIEVDPEDTARGELPVRCEFLAPEKFERFRGDKRYANALGFSSRRPDVTVLAAFNAGDNPATADPIAMVGASDDSALMRQLGVDVLPEFSHRSLASVLVRDVARMVLAEGYLPFYGTGGSHIISQRVAVAAGLTPTWWELTAGPRAAA